MKRIIITGGHLTPALVVIKKLQEEGGWKVLFIGRKHTMEGDKAASIESQVIPETGVDFVSIQAGRIPRTTTRYSFLTLLKIPLGFFQAFYHLFRFRPDVVLSFGGYLAVPVVLAGWLLRVPIITHEQSVAPGLGTRFISLFAKKIAVSWEKTLSYFPQKKTVLTGNPIREEILKISPSPTTNRQPPTIYITGGNQGAHAINEVVRKCLPKLLGKYKIIHQCGTVEYYQDYKNLKSQISNLKSELKQHYKLAKWFNSKEVAEIFQNADLVVSRAGINIISELAFLAKPAILIPFPFLKEQTMNAEFLAETGLAEILPQEGLNSKRLLALIGMMIKNLKKYQKQGYRARRLVKRDAGRKLTEIVKACGR